MPLYFVRVRDGDNLLPNEGEPKDYRTLDQVRDEAVASARELLSMSAREGKAGTLNQEVVVLDEQGNEVFKVPVGRAIDTDTQD